jgi:hypothetical protein
MKPLIWEDMELAIERETEACCDEVLEQCQEVLCDQMYKWFYNEQVDFMTVEEDYRSDKILELYIEISLALWDDDSYYFKKDKYYPNKK